MSRENLKLLIVAALCLTISWSGPAVAAVVFAQNSDKVDGKHAVGSGATTAARKGKLVATSPTTGRLPNNLIAVALDAAKLGGVSAASMRTLALPSASVLLTGGATDGGFGPFLPLNGANDFSGFRTTFIIPPGHKAGAPLLVDVGLWSGGLCEFRGQLTGDVGGFFFSATAGYPKTLDYYHVPAAAGHRLVTFSVPSPDITKPLVSGQVVELQFTRQDETGTCTSIEIPGLQVRY